MIHWTIAVLIAFVGFAGGLGFAFWVLVKGLTEAVEEFFERLL